MKKLLLPLLLLTAMITTGQEPDRYFHASAGAGYADKPSGELQAGYTTGRLTAHLGLIRPPKAETGDVQAAYFKVSYGWPIGYYGTLETGGGYVNHFGKGMKAELITMGVIFYGAYLHQIGGKSQVYVAVNKSRAVFAVTAGIRLRLFELTSPALACPAK